MKRELDKVIARIRERLIRETPLINDAGFFHKCALIAYREMIKIDLERCNDQE